MKHIYPDWMPPETFGERVKRLRTERGMSLRDVNAVCGMNISNMSRIERGGDTQLSHLVMIAKAFDMTPSELIAGLTLSELK